MTLESDQQKLEQLKQEKNLNIREPLDWLKAQSEKDALEDYSGDAILDRKWQNDLENHPDQEVRDRFKTARDFFGDDKVLRDMKGINFTRKEEAKLGEVKLDNIEPNTIHLDIVSEFLKQYQDEGKEGNWFIEALREGINFTPKEEAKIGEVKLVDIEPNTILKQYQVEGKEGNWFTMGSDKSELGIQGDSISSQNRTAVYYIVNEKIVALKSTSADIENWTQNNELYYGGGEQYYIKDEYKNALTKVWRSPENN